MFAMFSIVCQAVIATGAAGGGGGQCGTRQAKLLKLHKVGSTTVSNILIDYAGTWNPAHPSLHPSLPPQARGCSPLVAAAKVVGRLGVTGNGQAP